MLLLILEVIISKASSVHVRRLLVTLQNEFTYHFSRKRELSRISVVLLEKKVQEVKSTLAIERV